VTDSAPARIHWFYAALIIVLGALGWWAAFNLTMDKFLVLENPKANLSCSINVFVECKTNLKSWQGSLFGFPNPLIGLSAFIAPIAVGTSLLAGARFRNWFWILFNIGLLGAFVFCAWLMTQSFFVLGTICLWCVLTWSVVIPLFVVTTALNLSRGVYGAGAVKAGGFLLRWSPLIVIALYLVVAVIAQVRFDLINQLFR
jgi:uncharacterized membrane protein